MSHVFVATDRELGRNNLQTPLAGVISGVMTQVDELMRQPIYLRLQRPSSTPRSARKVP